MNLKRLSKIFLGIYLMATSFSVGANEFVFFGKTAHAAFKDHGVVELLEAVIGSNVSEAKSLIAHGVNVNAVGQGGVTPLLWVELQKDTRAAQLLLDLGADPNKSGPVTPGEMGFGPPLWTAAAAGAKEMVKILLDHGADPNLAVGGISPLMKALRGRYFDCAELLLQRGADINYSEAEFSPTAFDMGMIVLQYDVVLWVLNHGYTHDLERARLGILREHRITRPGQEDMKKQVLEILDRLIAQQQKQ